MVRFFRLRKTTTFSSDVLCTHSIYLISYTTQQYIAFHTQAATLFSDSQTNPIISLVHATLTIFGRFKNKHFSKFTILLAERGIIVSCEAIRLWCIKFGSIYSRRLKRKHRGYGDTFFIDEVFVKINGKQHYLWRAVDQDGEVVDVYLQAKRDGTAAKRFFKRLLRSHGGEPRKIVTDKLRSYGVAHRELIPETAHSTQRYENNRAEQSQEARGSRRRG